MSRCFPFPPPGYERKNRPDDTDLVKEAERKEKKHKKEKDKERKKNKERKEKDGTDEKHRHKKHRKEKHKDKEDRGKDKEKSSISEESIVAAKIEEGGEKRNSRVHNYDSSIVDEERNSILFKGQNGAKPFQNNLLSQETKESKFVQELDRRFRADETSRGIQFPVDGFTSLDTKDRETDARSAIRNSSGVSVRENEYNNDKRVDTMKLDVRDFRNEVCGRWEGKESYSETGDVKQEDKHTDKDKKSHRKGKDKEKKREKAMVKLDNMPSDQDRFKETGNSYNVGISNDVSADLFKEPKSSSLNDGNIKKRKDLVSNGFLLESEIRPAKIQRHAPYRALENGRIVEDCHTSSSSTPDRPVIPNNVRLVKNDGVIEGHKPSPSKPTLPSTTLFSDKKVGSSKMDLNLNKVSAVPVLDDLIMEALKRSPHPDSKCLSEVLTVPKLGECCDIDDLEWLFSKKGASTEQKSASFDTEDELYVWSEAVHMEAADVCAVCALPYVIPY